MLLKNREKENFYKFNSSILTNVKIIKFLIDVNS